MSISYDDGRIEYGDKLEHGFYAKDPVCGMTVEIARAAARCDHDGRVYHFCSERCRDMFLLAPQQYVIAHR
jgi:YHS domain-containing protein